MLNRDKVNIFSAIRDNSISQMNKLLVTGVDLAATNSKDQTPIQYALLLQRWNCINAIIKAKIKTDAEDKAKYGLALLAFVKRNDYENAKRLLEAGALQKWVSSVSMYSCLHHAVANNNTRLLKLLLAHGGSLASKNDIGLTPIQLAVNLRRWDMVKDIAQARPTNDKDTAKYTHALFSVIDQYTIFIDLSVMISLVNAGASLTATNDHGFTLIEWAVKRAKESYNWNAVAAIVALKKTDEKDEARYGSALLFSVTNNRDDMVKLFLDAGTPIALKEEVDDEGNTYLHSAIKNKNIKILQLLIQGGAQLSSVNHNEETPVQLAAKLKDWVAMQLLIEANNNKKNDKESVDVLHYKEALLSAIKGGALKAVSLLLENGAPCNEYSEEEGNVALYWAVKSNNPAIVALLMQQGALDVKNKAGETAENLATRLKLKKCFDEISRAKIEDKPLPWPTFTPTLSRNNPSMGIVSDSWMPTFLYPVVPLTLSNEPWHDPTPALIPSSNNSELPSYGEAVAHKRKSSSYALLATLMVETSASFNQATAINVAECSSLAREESENDFTPSAPTAASLGINPIKPSLWRVVDSEDAKQDSASTQSQATERKQQYK